MKNRHLLNIACALRFQASLPLKFWGECVLTATYLVNRTPTKLLNYKTPSEVLFGVPPTYDHLKVVRCLCYAHSHAKPRDKCSTIWNITNYLYQGMLSSMRRFFLLLSKKLRKYSPQYKSINHTIQIGLRKSNLPLEALVCSPWPRLRMNL